MDFNATIDLIIRELDEAREIIDDLKKYPGAPLMQIELARSKCRNASEIINMLKDVPPGFPVDREKAGPENLKKKAEQANPPGEQDETKPLPRDIPDGPAPGKENKIPDEQKTIPGKAEKKPYVAPIIADTFSHLANSYNEQSGDTGGEEFSYMHGKKYTSLSDAIGVNDRFFYIREIFSGDREAYHQALSRLDKVETITEAKVVLMSYKADKKENAAMKQLLELVKRKFSENE